VALIISVHLGDVVGAEVVNQFVKSLLVFRAVLFRELFHRVSKFSVQLGTAGHSVAVHSEIRFNKNDLYGNESIKIMIFRVRGFIPLPIVSPVELTGHAVAREAELVALGFSHGVIGQFRMSTSEHQRDAFLTHINV